VHRYSPNIYEIPLKDLYQWKPPHNPDVHVRVTCSFFNTRFDRVAFPARSIQE